MSKSDSATPPVAPFDPSLTALQPTMRNITETLAAELAHPTRLAPGWSEFEWKIARAVAAMHGVSALLSKNLQWTGPADWSAFLEAQRAHTARRHARIQALLQRIDGRASEEGVPAVALKGAALHSMGLYAADERPMADIDVLVRPADALRTAKALESMGFYESSTSWKERVFSPVTGHATGGLGEHSNNDVKIELHERICERLPWRITDITDRIFPPHAQPGLNPYPSTASLMVHLLLHAAGAMAYQALRLLHLHDVAQLSSRMTEADWDEVLAQGAGGKQLWWAFPPLKLASRYYSSLVPARVLAALAAECPFLLDRVAGRRTLYEVSFSYPRIDAFPGIEWSRSFREVLEYAVNRVRPSAEHIANREQTPTMQGWASESQWVRLSQSRRIVRWLISRPVRPMTLHAVRAALGQAHGPRGGPG